MAVPRFVFETHATTDLHLRDDVEVSLLPTGVWIGNGSSAFRFIPTETRPAPGAKVTADTGLGNLIDSPFAGSLVPGGGGLNVAISLAAHLREAGGRAMVRVINTADSTPELQAFCDAQGVEIVSLGRRPSPVNLVAKVGGDRLIIKEPARPPARTLEARQRRVVRAAAEDASVVASISSKDPLCARELLAAASAGARCLQPTGSLGRADTLRLLRACHITACNLDELRCLAEWAGIAVPLRLVEEDLGAPSKAAALLCELHRRGLAGRAGAVVTLGQYGSIAADWHAQRVERVALQWSAGAEAPPTPCGAGDLFLGRWLGHRFLGRPGPRTIAAAARATEDVARILGMRTGDFEVWHFPFVSATKSRGVPAA